MGDNNNQADPLLPIPRRRGRPRKTRQSYKEYKEKRFSLEVSDPDKILRGLWSRVYSMVNSEIMEKAMEARSKYPDLIINVEETTNARALKTALEFFLDNYKPAELKP